MSPNNNNLLCSAATTVTPPISENITLVDAMAFHQAATFAQQASAPQVPRAQTTAGTPNRARLISVLESALQLLDGDDNDNLFGDWNDGQQDPTLLQ